jgi:hypothetical protein
MACPVLHVAQARRPHVPQHPPGQEQGRPAERGRRSHDNRQGDGISLPFHHCLERRQHLAPHGVGILDERIRAVRDCPRGARRGPLPGELEAKLRQRGVGHQPPGFHGLDQRPVDVQRGKQEAHRSPCALSRGASPAVHPSLQLPGRQGAGSFPGQRDHAGGCRAVRPAGAGHRNR